MTALRVSYVIGTTAGGTGRHVAMLARGCALAGVQVSVFGPPETRSLFLADSGSEGEPGGVRFVPLTITDRPRPAGDAVAIRRLRGLLKAAEPDIVHAHGMRAGAFAAIALLPATLVRRPREQGGRRQLEELPALVVTVHNAPPASAGTAAVYAMLERLVARRADLVLCVSPDLSERMHRLGALAVGRALVPAPAGPESPVAAQPDTAGLAAGGRPVVLAVGRLATQKGLDTLLEAAARWRGTQPEPLVVIAGTGPLAAGLAHQAHQLGVDALFLGARADVPALLAAAAVFVLPSRWEGQPLVLQEALQAARPIVASDVGGVRDLTGDDAACLVAAGDPAALAAAVLRVLEDRDLAHRLAAAAAARAATLPTEADATAAALAWYDKLRPR